MAEDIAILNRRAWSHGEVVRLFSRLDGFIDAGERAALLAVAPRVRGRAALDVGVGTGRTVALLRLLTDDYVAIDYTPAMVEASRALHPGADIREGDARSLPFGDAVFSFVFFSYSGIDAVTHEDRATVLREFHRVLGPGGWLVFSTHNKDGPSYGEVPWRGYPMPGSVWYRALRWLARLPANLNRYRRSWANWMRNRHLSHDAGAWGISTSAPHDFGLVLHYVTLGELQREVGAAGFSIEAIFASNDGRRVIDGQDIRDVDAFDVVAQKR